MNKRFRTAAACLVWLCAYAAVVSGALIGDFVHWHGRVGGIETQLQSARLHARQLKIAWTICDQLWRPERGNALEMVRAVDKHFDGFDLPGVSKMDVYALFAVEVSNFDRFAMGEKGELGLGQLLPETVEAVKRKLGRSDLDPFDVGDNVLMTLAWIEEKVAAYGGREAGLIGYNGFAKKDGVLCRRYLNLIDKMKSRLARTS